MSEDPVDVVDEETRGLELVEPWSGLVERQLDLVLEPLGDGYYAWRLGEQRGLSRIEIEKTEKSQDAKPRETRYWVDIAGERFEFKTGKSQSSLRRFLAGGTLPFRVPTLTTVKDWASGRRRSRPITELFKMVEHYVTILLDLEEASYEAKVDALWMLQTWLHKISDWCGNLDVGGAFGAGKTAITQTLGEICYHSIGGTTSPAALARLSQKYHVTWILDEYDKARKADAEGLLDLFIRQGDRKGLLVTRWNTEIDSEETFDPFGPKLINYRTSLETGVKQRSIYHQKMTKSPDSRLPIINMIRSRLSTPIFEELWLWYMDQITRVEPVLPELPQLPLFLGVTPTPGNGSFSESSRGNSEKGDRDTPEKSGKSGNSGNSHDRQLLYDQIVRDLSPEERGLLARLTGRAGGLGFIMMRVAKAVGLPGFVKELDQAFEVKTLEEEEGDAYEPKEIVRNVIARLIYEEKKEGALHTDIYKEARTTAEKEWGQELTKNMFGRTLTELGFREKKTIKRKRGGGRWLIFDKTIKEGIPEPVKEDEVLPPSSDGGQYRGPEVGVSSWTENPPLLHPEAKRWLGDNKNENDPGGSVQPSAPPSLPVSPQFTALKPEDQTRAFEERIAKLLRETRAPYLTVPQIAYNLNLDQALVKQALVLMAQDGRIIEAPRPECWRWVK